MSDSTDQISPNDIAIVGMALRVPGARNTREFWENLRGGVESIRDVTEEELLAAGEAASRIHAPNYVRRTAELPDMEMFDAEFFGLGPREAAIMDPQHRQFLECAWEAMEDAGRTPDSGAGPVGVFAGCGMGSYFYVNVCSNRQLVDQVGLFLLRHTGNDKDFLATRASFAFDLRGPSINVQTACSTSLVAVHLACQSLLSGECEMALAGGVTIELPHRRGYLHQEGEILAPDGHCRAFDHRAAGTVFGSGVGVVALRRLSDALADGDIVHAVIKGSAVNNDGASKATYLAPSVNGQAEAIIEAQGLAGVSADGIQYVECHGTGTYLGDPIEIEALTQAFRQSTSRTGFCRVGSVKSNIGHLDTAAGIVSLIKASLALKHGEMPATLGFEKPNPSIDFARSPFIVNDRLTPWPSVDGPRRAAVNSLGVGGTNAHVVLEQAPGRAVLTGRASGEDEPQLFVLSAKQRKVLDQAMLRLGAALERDPALSLADAAFTLHAGRKPFEHRRVIAARGREEAVALLRDPETRRAFTHSAIEAAKGAVFLFPGGGAQHPSMAGVLYREDARFRADIDEALSALAPDAAAETRRVWMDGGLDAAEAASVFLRPSLQLPAILAVEVAVARHWIRQGVSPVALIGHSMGENAAACIAGVLSLRDAMRLVRLRGELFDTIEAGGMLSVPVSAATLSGLLPPELDLASVNAPELCVVSGRNRDLEAFAQRLRDQGIEASRIPIDIAAHSRMLEPILGRFEAFLRGIRLNAPTIPIVSNLTGDWLSDAQARDPLYWVRHLRSTVEFGKGIALLAAEPGHVFIEVGPGRALSSLVKLQPGLGANRVINSLPHADEAVDDRVHLLAALGRAWATGLDVPLERLWEGQGARRVPLPTYPFQRQRHFIEQSLSPQAGEPVDDLIRKQPDLADWGYRPSWRASCAAFTLGADAVPGSCLVFLDEAGLGADLVAELRAGGHRVATVRVGDGFARHGAGAFSLCPEDGRAGYDALLAGLATEGPLPQHILHLWLVTADERHRPGSSFLNRTQEQGFHSLFHLAQALGDAGAPDGLQITVVTNGMQRLGNEPLPYPEKATVLGPCLTMPKEMPGIGVRVIDLHLPEPEPRGRGQRLAGGAEAQGWAALRGRLREEIFAEGGSEVVAYRDGRRWSASFDKLPLPPPQDDRDGFRHGGVYLITGGSGDLALVMARQLHERYDAKLLLVGRSALPPRETWPLYLRCHPRHDRMRRVIEQVSAIEAAGGMVAYRSADVGNPEEMAAVVAEAVRIFGQIDGVLHTAGLVDDELMQMKTLERAEAVLAPKLHGTIVLDRLFKDVELDLFVLFSSTSTDTAPAGQADYVAANAYLNAYAESRAGDPKRRTVAIHWGIWNEVGLAARATAATRTDAPQAPEPAKGPFFTRWIEDADGYSWLEAELSPRTHWLLDEHRMLSGQPVLPGTASIEIAAQAAREYGIDGTLAIHDLSFLRPLPVADGERLALRVRLAPEAGGYRLHVAAAPAGSGDEVFVDSAEASLRVLAPRGAHTRIDLAGAMARCPLVERAEGMQALPSVQDRHLRFGPRWRVLRGCAFAPAEAFAVLSLPDAYRADLTEVLFHPALLDIATGFAMRLVPGYEASDVLWVPMSYGGIVLRGGSMPASLMSRVRLRDDAGLGEGYACFDVTITDAEGQVLVEIERFVMKRLDDDLGLLAERPERPSRAPHRGAAAQRPAAIQLAAQVGQGILPQEGFEALRRVLASGQPQPIVSSMDLEALRRRAASPPPAAAAQGEHFERPDLDNDYVAPRNEIERILAGFWAELLGVERIGVEDSFFDIGGHSLIAVRLFRMIKQRFALDLPISVLFEAPTISACAALIAQRCPSSAGEPGAVATQTREDEEPARLHLVTMSSGEAETATPFFLCAGMFGNVLNLRQLAMHLGVDRPVYGLQARGLYGDQAPHETFEEAARDYLAEIRSVQPHGPYLLGGFSGGGLVAYEMARQLREVGEDVSLLVMLDTPLPFQPALGMRDKLMMKWQDLRRHGVSFFTNWLEERARWREEQRRKETALGEDSSGAQFHNARIEAAFRAALGRYTLRPHPGKVLLLRPKLNIVYRISGGRFLQDGRNPAIEDNGWTPYVTELEVQEVAGDHDSMVLEPFVRVLASRLRARLAQASRAEEPFRAAAE